MLHESEADWFHLDVMDGRFVPNISFGLPVVAAMRKTTDKVFDVHLMIEEPEKYAEEFKKVGADVLTVHVDGRASNRGLVGPADFALMQPGVVFINAARGFVVDSVALAGFLRANAGALGMLDVHEPEPVDASYPLLGLPNAHLYPHLASATALANTNMSWVVKDVWRVLNGEEPVHRGVAEV